MKKTMKNWVLFAIFGTLLLDAEPPENVNTKSQNGARFFK